MWKSRGRAWPRPGPAAQGLARAGRGRPCDSPGSFIFFCPGGIVAEVDKCLTLTSIDSELCKLDEGLDN